MFIVSGIGRMSANGVLCEQSVSKLKMTNMKRMAILVIGGFLAAGSVLASPGDDADAVVNGMYQLLAAIMSQGVPFTTYSKYVAQIRQAEYDAGIIKQGGSAAAAATVDLANQAISVTAAAPSQSQSDAINVVVHDMVKATGTAVPAAVATAGIASATRSGLGPNDARRRLR